MRALALPALAAVAFVLPAPAAAGTIRTAGPVEALGVTATETIFAARESARCVQVGVYDNADHGVRRYARHCWEATSTGSGVAGVAVSGGRALWLTYVGGNTRDWTLYTRTTTGGARVLRRASSDVDAPPPIVIGTASEQGLPYSVGSALTVVRRDGSRALSWQAPARIVASSAQGSSFTAVLENGDVAELAADGTLLGMHDYAPHTVRSSAGIRGGILVQTGRTIELRRGAEVQSFPVPAGARLAGFSSGVVAYATASELHLLRTADGRDVVYQRLPRGFRAGLDRRGAAWAAGRTVTFRVSTDLAAALSRP
jgi:hypothetical protein